MNISIPQKMKDHWDNFCNDPEVNLTMSEMIRNAVREYIKKRENFKQSELKIAKEENYQELSNKMSNMEELMKELVKINKNKRNSKEDMKIKTAILELLKIQKNPLDLGDIFKHIPIDEEKIVENLDDLEIKQKLIIRGNDGWTLV
jgi:metal-responsive CopG/Arc/MetJ family transcriptional regulator